MTSFANIDSSSCCASPAAEHDNGGCGSATSSASCASDKRLNVTVATQRAEMLKNYLINVWRRGWYLMDFHLFGLE